MINTNIKKNLNKFNINITLIFIIINIVQFFKQLK